MFRVIGLATVVISEAKMSTFEQFDIILSASPSSMTQWGIDPLGPGTPRPNWGDDLRFPSDSHLLPTQDVISHLIGHGTSHLSPASCSSIVSRHYNNPKYRAHAEGEFATMSCKLSFRPGELSDGLIFLQVISLQINWPNNNNSDQLALLLFIMNTVSGRARYDVF